MNSNLKLALAIASGVMIAGPASTQTPPAAPTPQGKPQARSADEIICQKQEVVGSRLATRRVCMTRLQWQDQRLQDRQDTTKAQTPAAKNTPGG